ncbi:MmcQ/YjbR family DNA-binding protein [Dietzia aurantiaca]|uniref:MmcQ/YjbR family DNA-binding protein n=1 Tax=Dietzia aurantiaca TaxID=983873 RepID=A0ABV9PW77_9ACTN
MNGQELQRRAAERAREPPASTLEFPFGPEYEVYKVAGKIFLFLVDQRGEPIVTLKALPSDSIALREAHPDITPGYHMNKRHWISLRPGGPLTADEVSELVMESYRLVVAALPRAMQPVEPHAFGRGQR